MSGERPTAWTRRSSPSTACTACGANRGWLRTRFRNCGCWPTSVPNWWRSEVGSPTGSTAICSALVMWSGSWGRSTGPVVRALIEDFCANGSVAMHRDHFSDIRIPAGVVRVFDQRWKRIDALDQEIKMIEELCIKQADGLTWRIGAGRTASGRQLRSNLESIPGVGTQTVITWLAEVGDITRFGSVNKLLAYAGLDPSDQISAGKVTGTKMRKGNARLHGALRNAARAMFEPCPVVQVLDVGARIHGASLPRRQVESDPRVGAAGRQGVVLLPSQK